MPPKKRPAAQVKLEKRTPEKKAKVEPRKAEELEPGEAEELEPGEAEARAEQHGLDGKKRSEPAMAEQVFSQLRQRKPGLPISLIRLVPKQRQTPRTKPRSIHLLLRKHGMMSITK